MKRFVLVIIIILSMIVHSIAIADWAEREGQKKACMENLNAIGKAIDAYRADHEGEIPNWLSELYPKYLQDPKILLCPADETGGTPAGAIAYKEPKMPCSYLYDFNPLKYSGGLSLFDKNPPESYTYREGKRLQLKYFGHRVPVVRCSHHGAQALNLDYDGKIYFSPGAWEYTPESAKAVLSFLQGVIKNNPDGWEKEVSLNSLSDYFRNVRRLPNFLILLEGHPHLSADALKILAGLYKDEGKIIQAIATYQRVIGRVPDDVETLLVLAKLHAGEKNSHAARQKFLLTVLKFCGIVIGSVHPIRLASSPHFGNPLM